MRTLSVWLSVILLAAIPASASESVSGRTTVIVVVGAAGEEEFGSNFVRQAASWEKSCLQAGARLIMLGRDTPDETNDRERLKLALESEEKDGPDGLWLLLIGHGTFDDKEARFNLRGPDVSATELALWLQPFRRPLAVINTASSSAPFLNKLAATNRVIITATRSGHEQNLTRFGQYLSEVITHPEADLDKDDQVSLLEAFLIASRKTSEFYKLEGRILTEHALLDDSGDGLGTPADWFRGLRAIKRSKENAPVDGLLAQQFHLIPSQAERRLTPEQRSERDALERAVVLLRERKGQLAEEQYYRDLEMLLLKLGRFYEPRPGTNAPTTGSR